MDVLRTIMAERADDARAAARSLSRDVLEAQASRRTPRPLRDALARAGTHIVAETKKASPSAGVLCASYDPAATATRYAEAGAIGISVLTEPRHFEGAPEHLQAVRDAVALPVLRKDFIAHPFQVLETAAMGADVILLIVAGLDTALMQDLYEEARARELDVLVEAHTGEELERALACPDAIVGVNSRNLKTLETDLDVARALGRDLPPDRIAIAESGIRTREDILSLEAAGYRGFLVGESLLRHGDPGAALRALRGA